MMPLQRYIAEEIATDHADGLYDRREALRRLGMLGMSAAAASTLLAACSSNKQATPPAPTPSHQDPLYRALPPMITFAGPEGRTLQAAWAQVPQPRGGVLVIHQNTGLTDQIRSVAERFAGIDYNALALDLLSEEGGTGGFSDKAAATAALAKAPQDRLIADLQAGVDELARRTPGKKLGVTGFCFGGGLTWLLLTRGTPKLAAATPFYGPFPENGDLSQAKAAVLAIYAGKDARVGATRPAAEAALAKAGLPHDTFIAQDADHAFFDESGPRYNEAAATEAWRRVVDWYQRYLG